MRYKYKMNNKRIGLKSFILTSFLEKYMIMKHKLNKTVLINEKLGPMIIEIGKTENSIVGIFVFTFSIFFI